MKILKNNIKYIREKVLQITVSELASKIDVKRQTIYCWESDPWLIPDYVSIKKIADLAGRRVEEVILEEDV